MRNGTAHLLFRFDIILALQLDFLCSFFSNLRLKFWLIAMTVLLLVVATLAVSSRVADSTAAFGRPTTPPPEQVDGPAV